jgi:Protein of unknown function (DUF2817)
LESHEIDAVSPINDRLTIDVAIFGNPLAHKTLVISSGLHGVEGFFGSAVQLALIDRYLTTERLSSDLAIVMIHILNPFGCAWYRRCNEDNIDLNRNFPIGSELYRGYPPDYPSLDRFLNPCSAPSRFEPFLLESARIIRQYGMATLKNTLPVGQYEFPQGLFFGGIAPSQTHQILTAHLRRWLGISKQVLHLDLHSGLGKWGTYQLFAELMTASPRYRWLSARLSDEQIVPLDADEMVYQQHGTFGRWCQASYPDLTYDFLLAEFGTHSMVRVLKALRAENRAHWWGAPEDRSYQWAKRELLEAFVPKSQQWRKIAIQQGFDLCLAGIGALG